MSSFSINSSLKFEKFRDFESNTCMYIGGGLRKIVRIELFELYYFYIEINYIQDKT